eukprot:2607-Heterococcus_DN1.PRE.9
MMQRLCATAAIRLQLGEQMYVFAVTEACTGVDAMLRRAEDIRRNDMSHEQYNEQLIRREQYPDYIQHFPATGAITMIAIALIAVSVYAIMCNCFSLACTTPTTTTTPLLFQVLDLDVSITVLHQAQQRLSLAAPHFSYTCHDGSTYTAECHLPASLQLRASGHVEPAAPDCIVAFTSCCECSVKLAVLNFSTVCISNKQEQKVAAITYICDVSCHCNRMKIAAAVPAVSQQLQLQARMSTLVFWSQTLLSGSLYASLEGAGVLSDSLEAVPPSTHLTITKYEGYDAELTEDHSRGPLPTTTAADLRLLPLAGSVCDEQQVTYLYEVPVEVLNCGFAGVVVVPQRFGLLLSAQLDPAVLAYPCSVVEPEVTRTSKTAAAATEGPAHAAADRGYIVVPLLTQGTALDWSAVDCAIDGGGNSSSRSSSSTVLMVSRRQSTDSVKVQRCVHHQHAHVAHVLQQARTIHHAERAHIADCRDLYLQIRLYSALQS